MGHPLTSATPLGSSPNGHGGAGTEFASIVSRIPQRLALAGGWIDQPFLSRHNPAPPGSMVVVGLEPVLWFMDRCGMASSTRKVATKIWDGALPHKRSEELVRELYGAENAEKAQPSGSQDMIGLIYPGVNRLDYDADFEGGVFPAHIESNCDPDVGGWLERVLHLVPISQRPPGYNPLGVTNLDPEWIGDLGRTGRDCFDAIIAKDVRRLGGSLNRCMECWEAILPQTVMHPLITVDLKAVLSCCQLRYPGAMYSGCGGGYLIIVSEEPVPGSIRLKVRLSSQTAL